MRAVVLDESGVRFDSEYSATEPSGAIPVRVLKAGICETDLQLIQGYMGFRGVLGHEFVGIAEAGQFAGERVVGEINCACGDCRECRAGLGTHCPHRTVVGILNHDGAFAERVWLPEENLHVVPDNVSDEAAVFVEPLAAAFQIPAQLDLSRFPECVVLGDGRLGNLCAQVLRHQGCRVRVVGKHPEKLERLARLGLSTCLLSEVAGDRDADLVVDCTGSPTGMPTAVGLVKPRGTIVMKTTVAGETGPNLASVVIDELTVVGSRCGPFPAAIKALAEGAIDVTSLITHIAPLEEATAALELAKRPDQLKVLLHL